MYDFDSMCPGYRIFNITHSEEVVEAFKKVQFYTFQGYSYIITFLAPVNIAANLLGSGILLTKELRNPFNLILCFMCFDPVIPLLIRATMTYRNMGITECRRVIITDSSANTVTNSLALHTVIEFNSWAPFRATYTWLAVILTFMRFRALRSKGKWEASYLLVVSASLLVALLTIGTSVPLFITNIVGEAEITYYCASQGVPVTGPTDVIVPIPMYNEAFYDNDCLIYRLNNLITGTFHNILPSFLLLLSTVLLTLELSRARQGHMTVARQSARKNDDAVRASRLLIIIAILTLLSELPQGLASIGNMLFSIGFQGHYSDRLQMLWAAIQICTTGCNLVVSLAMSKNFRKALSRLICFWRKQEVSTPVVSVVSTSSMYNSTAQCHTI